MCDFCKSRKPNQAEQLRHDEYLVVWHRTCDDGTRAVYTRRMSSSGQPLAGPFLVSYQLENQVHPVMACDIPGYLIAYEGRAADDTERQHIYGRMRWPGGGDKVTRDELRATADPNAVHNSVWDGPAISLFGARNEVVSFNLVLEAPATDAANVDVTLAELTGPDGASITTRPASADDDVFNYVGRNIELFYVRYLEIKGLSVDLAYSDYDERHTPGRFRRPHDADGHGTGDWEDRPDHNKLYPDIAVSLELHTPFTVPAGTNQPIWGDIYISKASPAGVYTGTVLITENGVTTWQILIRLRVRDFALPDLPSARTMLVYGYEYANERYFGVAYPDPGTTVYAQSLQLADRHFQLAHRHKISVIDAGDIEPGDMAEAWTDRLNGDLFTPARGYGGIGVGVGNNVYSIGTYSSWSWQDGDEADMWANTDLWVTLATSKAWRPSGAADKPGAPPGRGAGCRGAGGRRSMWRPGSAGMVGMGSSSSTAGAAQLLLTCTTRACS